MVTNNVNRLGLLLLLSALVFAAVGCSTGPEPVYVIKGTITDSVTGAPIDSAQIIVGDTTTSTKIFYSGPQGHYKAYPDTVGRVQVFCRKATYQTKVITVELAVSRFLYEGRDFELVRSYYGIKVRGCCFE